MSSPQPPRIKRPSPNGGSSKLEARMAAFEEKLGLVAAATEDLLAAVRELHDWVERFHPRPARLCPHCHKKSLHEKRCTWCGKPLTTA